jgi:hypothetical protein
MMNLRLGVRLRGAGVRVSVAVICALSVLALSACTMGLLDLVAFQVLSNETAMLYVGYKGYEEVGYGVARVGATTGALEVFRQTLSATNVNGCAAGIDPRPITAEAPWPNIYYAAEFPNRIKRTDYSGVNPAQDAFLANPGETTKCLQVVEDGPLLAVFWSTAATITYSFSEGEGGGTGWGPLALPIQYVSSFDVEPGPISPTTLRPLYFRIYYMGMQQYRGVDSFGIIGINSNNSSEALLFKIGRYVDSNLVLLDGYLYYVTQNPHGLFRIKADGSQTVPTTLLTPIDKPYAIAVDPDSGTLYWLEHNDTVGSRIMRADPGATSGVPVLENLPYMDRNGFFFYRP